ncbi:MAG TPA: hypothetical protein DD462_06190 [Leeuwenhoekiella sp.]|jgi:energy-coupling factor transporter ATP-binding protein EcfA2|nr:hypothetical protein [Leeuwenhoekiella sp.]|tara:strand:- start:5733 stop:8102 length:2370 start_codon:yes stop_codon:yes gene_type:complete
MRLVAIYILEHYLYDGPQTINLIGKYFYAFEKSKKKLVITRTKNKDYIAGLHQDGISEISAIVGANGSGKTTLFSIINKNNDDTRAILIYENSVDEIVIENRTGRIDEYGNISDKNSLDVFFNDIKIQNTVNIDIPVLYYSPLADEDLTRFDSPISKTSHFKSTLLEYHLDNVERSLMLMTDEIADEIKQIYPELPLYDFLEIRSKPLYKRDLRNVYGGFKTEGDLEKAQKVSLDKLWDTYENKAEDKEHLVHENQHFFKDVEVNILSYLIIDGTSMQTAFNGTYEISFEDIIQVKDFYKKLDHFFFHKLAYIDKYIYRKLWESYNGNDYHTLLFVFETTNFDEELIEQKESLLARISEIKSKTKSLSSNELGDYVSNNLDSIIVDEIRGEEFEQIRENLSKYIDHLFINYDDLDNESFNKKVESDLEEIEKGITKSFDEIFRSRYEIIDQLTSVAKRTITLFDSIKKLYLLLESIINKRGFSLNQGCISVKLKEVDFDIFKRVIQLYKRVIQALNSNSVIDAQLIEFRPNKRLSFGEKSLINLFSSLYEFTIKKYHHLRRKEHYILLLDEADLGFHPLWKKKYINVISKVTPLIFSKLNEGVDNGKNPNLENRKIQIIISTHDSLTLSDIPNYNITYIDKVFDDLSDRSKILSIEEKPSKSFGANIHDLLADSFFLKDGFMGEFAKEKIDEIIKWLNIKIIHNKLSEDSMREDLKEQLNKEQLELFENYKAISKKYCLQVIEIIDEPLLKNVLEEMYATAFPEDNEEIEEKIRAYARRLGRNDIADSL